MICNPGRIQRRLFGWGEYFSSQSNFKHKGLEDTLSGSDILFWRSQCNICSGDHNAKSDPHELPDRAKYGQPHRNLPKCIPFAKPEPKLVRFSVILIGLRENSGWRWGFDEKIITNQWIYILGKPKYLINNAWYVSCYSLSNYGFRQYSSV